MIEERRREDPRMAKLIVDVAHLHNCLETHTTVVREVRDILATFRVIAAVAKWVAAVGAAVSAVGLATHQGIEWWRKS